MLVQIQAHPTRQTEQGLGIRVIASAMNIKGGESIGRSVVDIPPPLDKPKGPPQGTTATSHGPEILRPVGHGEPPRDTRRPKDNKDRDRDR